MKPTVRFATLSLGAVTAVAAAAWVWWPQGAVPVSPAAGASSPGASGQVTPAVVPERTTCRFGRGDRLTYGLTVTSHGTQSVPGAGELPLDLALVGALELEVLQASSADAVLVGRLTQLKAKGGSAFDPEGLKAPFLVAVDSGCQLTRFARHQSQGRAAGRSQQALLWEAQFRLESSDAFRMSNGTGVAEGRLAFAGPAELRRTLERYVSRWGQTAAGRTEGALVVRVGRGPWFDLLSSRETQALEGGSVVGTLDLEKLPSLGRPFTTADRDLSAYRWEDLLPLHQDSLVQRPFTRFDAERQQKVANQTPKEALDSFVDRVNRKVGIQSTWPELSAYFEVHPESIRPAVRAYLDGELPDDATGPFFLALSKARTPEALQQLLDLKRDDAGEAMNQVRAMFALVTRQDVGRGLAQEFVADVDHHLARRTQAGDFLARESVLAFSTMAGLQDDPAVSEVATEALRRLLHQGSETTAVQRAALAGVGNAGDPALLDQALVFSQAPDVQTRKDAANAFGRMPVEASEAAELAWLRREQNPFVKNKLYKVIWEQHAALRQGASRALVDQALRDLPLLQSGLARRNIIRLVSKSTVAQAPDVRAALVAQAKFERAHDTSLINEFSAHLTEDEVAEVLR
ncbi:MAG: hypothetical protein K1X89_08480 [Myxococcaceae bacterium]|nr:hypothetical protein [Myxococcaceae bacterium]